MLAVLRKAGLREEEIDFFAHGTTAVINAVTERKGARTGLITTDGFRDILEIARGNRPDFFNLSYEKPAPFVPRYLRRELPGRLDRRGREVEPLDLAKLPSILDDFRREGVEAIAVCLLYSYLDPGHEMRIVREIQESWPEISVVASSEITREWREYERTNTAVLSAYVQPFAERYLGTLQDKLQAAGYRHAVYVMQSNGGVDNVDSTRRTPIRMIESGPASGFLAAAEVGRQIGVDDILALDIGGTTAKCSLIRGGQVRVTTDYWLERTRRSAGYPVAVPVVDLVEIGNGGGSIAALDPAGKFHVGPQSAGASPGPAAYGLGGTRPTTTDANLKLGRISKDYFCGGTIAADMEAVDRALQPLADALSSSTAEIARGIVRIANHNMINALKLVSLNRGHDPRTFTLVAFGGGGGMHAVSLAAQLGMKRVIVPRGAAVFSALGMLMSDLRRDYLVTRVLDPSTMAKDEIARILDGILDDTVARARTQFVNEGVAADDLAFRASVKCRYANQANAIEVEVSLDEGREARLDRLYRQFNTHYEREFTYRLDAPVEIVGVHVAATSPVGKLSLPHLPLSAEPASSALKGRREVDFDVEGIHLADVYDVGRLRHGMEFTGPAVIEDPGATTIVHPGNRVRVDSLGNLDIAL